MDTLEDLTEFENLEETQKSTHSENKIISFLQTLNYRVARKAPSKRFPDYDIVVERDGIETSIELKLNDHEFNLALEYKQRLVSGIWVDSGLRTTKSQLYIVDSPKLDKIHVFEVSQLRHFLIKRYITFKDANYCNLYKRNPTVCYLVDYEYLELDGFFQSIYQMNSNGVYTLVGGEHI